MPVLIGIAGGSGAGKTTLALALATALREAVVVSMDAYYRDLSHLEAAARARVNFDTPEAIDWPRFIDDLRSLRHGAGIERPDYDFGSHTRGTGATPVTPRPFVIVEGLLLLHHADVRRLLDAAVFLDVDDQTARDRRVARDRRERGRTPDDILAQYTRDVRPMFARHVLPTRRWATLTLSGADPVETGVRSILAHLE